MATDNPLTRALSHQHYWNVTGNPDTPGRMNVPPPRSIYSPESTEALRDLQQDVIANQRAAATPSVNSQTLYDARVTHVYPPRPLIEWKNILEQEGLLHHYPELTDLIRSDADGFAGAGSVMVPMVSARIEYIMPMIPRPLTRGCGIPYTGQSPLSGPNAANQMFFLHIPSRTVGGSWQTMPQPSVGDIAKVRFRDGDWTDQYGYLHGLGVTTAIRGFDIEQLCTDLAASSAADAGEVAPTPLSQDEIAAAKEAAIAQAAEDLVEETADSEEIKAVGIRLTGGRGSGRGFQGGVVQFVTNFWGEGTDEGFFMSAEEADAARQEKPSRK
jgi:hypothetical protein